MEQKLSKGIELKILAPTKIIDIMIFFNEQCLLVHKHSLLSEKQFTHAACHTLLYIGYAVLIWAMDVAIMMYPRNVVLEQISKNFHKISSKLGELVQIQTPT